MVLRDKLVTNEQLLGYEIWGSWRQRIWRLHQGYKEIYFSRNALKYVITELFCNCVFLWLFIKRKLRNH